MITSKVKIYKPRLRLLSAHIHLAGKAKQKMRSISKCYQLLDVPESCSDDELKESYLKLVKISHPDRDAQCTDVAKFVEIQSAYKKIVEHRKTIKTVENEEDPPAKYKMPQHRQYLEYKVGSGPPSQRLKQHQQQKFSDALESLADHHMKQGKLSQEDALMKVNAKRAQKSMVRNAMDRLVEDLISESMKRGEFDNLSGLGKPLEARYKKENPYIDTTTYNLNKILINNGYVPNWVTLEKEIRESYVAARIKMITERLKIVSAKDSNRAGRKKSLNNFRADVKSVNKQIDRFNILAPSMVQQLFHYDAEDEIGKISKQSLETLEKSLLQLQSRDRPAVDDLNSSDKNHNNSSKSTNKSTTTTTTFKDIWREWRALFSRSS